MSDFVREHFAIFWLATLVVGYAVLDALNVWVDRKRGGK